MSTWKPTLRKVFTIAERQFNFSQLNSCTFSDNILRRRLLVKCLSNQINPFHAKTIFCNLLDIHTIPLYNIPFKRYKRVWFVNNIAKQGVIVLIKICQNTHCNRNKVSKVVGVVHKVTYSRE